jgi:hypothetical protein
VPISGWRLEVVGNVNADQQQQMLLLRSGNDRIVAAALRDTANCIG